MNNLEIVKFFEYNLKTGRLSPFYLLPDEKKALGRKGRRVYRKMFQTYENYSVWTENDVIGKNFTQLEYNKFMYSRKNIHNCDNCPENWGEGGSLPCGQQKCWVECHIETLEEAEE